jgi:hypothetical protein
VLIAAVTCNRDDDDNIKNVDFIWLEANRVPL